MGDINNILHSSSSCVSCLSDETESLTSIYLKLLLSF